MQPDSRLNQYVHNEVTVEEPTGGVPWATPDEGVLRDNPFGATPFGGETPFFVGGGGGGPAFASDDTDGIPLGLPDLLDLPEVSEVPTRAETETLVPIDEGVDDDTLLSAAIAPPAPNPLPPRISADPPSGPPPLQMFLLGLGVASAAWLVVLAAWIWMTFGR